jgi:hypothetical protein
MENNNNEYLPEYTINGLTQRVINRLGNFYHTYTPKNDSNVIKSCREIEANVQKVYNVIDSATKRLNSSGAYGYCYRSFLTSVYVLLYYRHRDDERYKMVVFPQLKRYMGEHAAKPILHEELDKMIEEDAMLRSLGGEDEIVSRIKKQQTSDDAKSIVLAENRGSDFVRVILAMYQCGYFEHKDKSNVSLTELGSMLMQLLGRTTAWKSLLQKAFDRDNPLSTFDKLRDNAQEYWQKRANIKD